MTVWIEYMVEFGVRVEDVQYCRGAVLSKLLLIASTDSRESPKV